MQWTKNYSSRRDDSEAHRIAWNTHEGLEIHYVLRGRFTWEIRNSRKQLSVNGGHFVIVPAGRHFKRRYGTSPQSAT